MVLTLSILTSCTFVAIVVLYTIQVLRGVSKPSKTNWWINLGLVFINVPTYIETVMGASLWVAAPTVVVLLGTVALFIIVMKKGEYSRAKWVDVVAVAIAAMALVLWYAYDGAVANVVLQGAYIASFWPTVVGLATGQLRERLPPWWLAVAAYSLMTMTVLLSWEPGAMNWAALAHPVLNGLVGNGSVIVIVLLKPRLDHYVLWRRLVAAVA